MRLIRPGYYRHLVTSTVFLACLPFSKDLAAADSYGQYGVRGAGLITCGIYEKERMARGDVYLMTAAWADGYITATNEHLADTYDVLSFESTELLMEILHRHCENNPADHLFSVLKSLLQKLNEDRLQARSEKVEIVVGDRKVSLYVEVLKRIKQKLASSGLYHGKMDAGYGQEMIRAMKSWQKSIGFEPTGFPDQATLWRLMRTAEKTAENT